MATFIDMPKLSDTMTVGTVANWLKNEGDSVESGDVIAEIETDKATMELEAFEDGVLLKQLVKAGEEVAIGEPIAAIGEEGEEVEAPAKKDSSPKKDDKEDKDQKKESSEKDDQKDEKKQDDGKGESDSSEESEPQGEGKSSDSEDSSGRIKASPLAKRVAKEEGVDLSSVKGTGPNGRIVKQDVLDAKKSGGASAEKSESKKSPAPATLPGLAIAEDEELRVSKMRGIIAKRLVESKVNAPHFYLQIEVDAANLLATRAKVNEDLAKVPAEHGGGIKLTVNDFILKASAEAMRRVPAMNRSWQGDTIRQSGAVHLAFGVAIDDGLLTPVIRNAESKTLKQIAVEAKELIGKARNKKLSTEEMSGSTFTVTNLGMFGTTSFYGIINTPNAGILSVGATVAKPVVNAAGEIVPGQIMSVGLSGDHRVVDGAVGAQYLQALKTLLETPTLALI